MQSMYVMMMHAIFGDMLTIQLEVALLHVQECCQVKLNLLLTKCTWLDILISGAENTVILNCLKNLRMWENNITYTY